MTPTAPLVQRTDTAGPAQRRRWRPNVLTWLIAVIALGGVGILLYPSMASWITSYNQSQLIVDYSQDVESADPPPSVQLDQAKRYNQALQAGVDVLAHTNIATGNAVLEDESLVYEDILSTHDDSLMAYVTIPSINLNLPIYHGTSDEVLNRGAGHLEGSHLPIGGTGTHAVITAHRGLAHAEMFTHLDRVTVGDRFTLEVFGEVLTYEVRESRVVEPHETDTLRPAAGLDQVTLITCTPLGINTHRILVTGERVSPAPVADITGEKDLDVPGFPWWAVGYAVTLIAVGLFVWRSGYADAKPWNPKGTPRP